MEFASEPEENLAVSQRLQGPRLPQLPQAGR
jgi:hypothetical protein